jgi:hypothetical protein
MRKFLGIGCGRYCLFIKVIVIEYLEVKKAHRIGPKPVLKDRGPVLTTRTLFGVLPYGP